jgi:NodT family efflux transporter outer membrane factor (OMF) lipoprotein
MKKARFSLDNLNVSLSEEIISHFIKLREAQQKLVIAQKNLKLQKEILDIVQNKYKNGIADLLSLNQAQYTVEQTFSNIPLIKEQVENYKNALSVLLGCLPKELPISLDSYKSNLVSKTFKYSVKNLYKLPLDIIHKRPDILIAEENLQAQHAVLNQAIASLYPSINLQTSFNYISPQGRHLFNSNNQVYGYTPGITAPIWHWKQLVNNVEIQRYIKEEAVLAYNEAVLCALTEIKNTLFAIEKAYQTNAHKKNSYFKMQNIMNLTLNKYKNGLISFTDVARAEQNLLESELAYIESNAQILQNFVSFYKAVGGRYNFVSYK